MKESIYTTEEQFYYLVTKQKKLKTIYNQLLKPIRYNFLESIKEKYFENLIKNNGIENLKNIEGLNKSESISIKVDQGYIYEYMITPVKDDFLLTQITRTSKFKNFEDIQEDIKDYIIDVEAYVNPNKEIHNIINKDSIINFRINKKQNKIFYEEINLKINTNSTSPKIEEINKRIENELKIVKHKINREIQKPLDFNILAYADSIYRKTNIQLELEIRKIERFLVKLEPLDLMQFNLIILKKELKTITLKKEMVSEPKMEDFMKRIINETLTIKNILENAPIEIQNKIKDKYTENTTIFTLKVGSLDETKKYIENAISKLNSLTTTLKTEYIEIKKKSSTLKLLDYHEFCNEFENTIENSENLEFQ